MPAKTKTASKRDVQRRRRAIGQAIKEIESSERKLNLQLKKLKDDLTAARWFMAK
jgi:hypothetical protein